MPKKTGSSFVMALGFFIIAISPLLAYKYLHILSGLSLVALGYYLMKKGK